MWYKDNTVFNSEQSIRNNEKDKSLPIFLNEAVISELGYTKVVDNGYTLTATQRLVGESVEVIDGVPTKVYNIIDKTTEELEAERKALVPQQITPRQARLALLQATLLDEVETMLANNKEMQIWWEYSLDIQRNHEHIVSMATALGLSENQLDDLFVLGETL